MLVYGAYRTFTFWTSYIKEDEREMHNMLALEKLTSIEQKTKAMQEHLENLTAEVKLLQQGEHLDRQADSLVSEWIYDVPYPLDRRREAAKSLQGTPSRFHK